MGETDKFKERAYEILYNKYTSIINRLISDSNNLMHIDNGSGEILKEERPTYIEKKVEKFEQIGKLEEWSKNSICSKEDIEIIKALEYCLREQGLPKKAK